MQCQRIVPVYSELTANVVMDRILPALLAGQRETVWAKMDGVPHSVVPGIS